jgi:hypothetical protein
MFAMQNSKWTLVWQLKGHPVRDASYDSAFTAYKYKRELIKFADKQDNIEFEKYPEIVPPSGAKDPRSLGFRHIPGLNMTRRRKEEVLQKIEKELSRLESLLGKEEYFTEPLDAEEQLLIAWFEGLILGRIEGKESILFEQAFRQRHNIKPWQDLPSPREMLNMEESHYNGYHGFKFQWQRFKEFIKLCVKYFQ